MKKKTPNLAYFIFILLLSGCSSVKFYEEGQGSSGTLTEVGFLYYPPKPYLLVDNKDGKLSATVISLPDKSKPHRVKHKAGWGSTEFSFVVEGGMIQSFNSKSDSKVPETLTSIAALGSAQAALEAVDASLRIARIGAGLPENFDGGIKAAIAKPHAGTFEYVVTAYETAIIELNTAKAKLSVHSNEFADEISVIDQLLSELQSNLKIPFTPALPDTLLDHIEDRRKLASKLADRISVPIQTLDIHIKAESIKPSYPTIAQEAKNALTKAAKHLNAFSTRNSSPTGLYEIVSKRNSIIFRKVEL